MWEETHQPMEGEMNKYKRRSRQNRDWRRNARYQTSSKRYLKEERRVAARARRFLKRVMRRGANIRNRCVRMRLPGRTLSRGHAHAHLSTGSSATTLLRRIVLHVRVAWHMVPHAVWRVWPAALHQLRDIANVMLLAYRGAWRIVSIGGSARHLLYRGGVAAAIMAATAAWASLSFLLVINNMTAGAAPRQRGDVVLARSSR